MASDSKNLKEKFDSNAAHLLANQLASVWGEFDSERFVRLTTRGLGGLEFRQRLQRFARALRETLPTDYVEALGVLIDSLPEPLPDDVSTMDGWLQWPIAEFIGLFGRDYPEDSLEAIEVLAQVCAAEYAMRPFLLDYPDEMIDFLQNLVVHPSVHVRRFCAESLRVRLPWAQVLQPLQSEPAKGLPVLTALRDDPRPEVRRAVADNLNDLSKTQPRFVLEVCRQWLAGAPKERRQLVSQALRGLSKEGSKEALGLLGFGSVSEQVNVKFSCSPRTLLLGESLSLRAALTSRSQASLKVSLDLVLHFPTAGEPSTAVFAWKALELASGQSLDLEKAQVMASESIKGLEAGPCRMDLRLNGEPVESVAFQLM